METNHIFGVSPIKKTKRQFRAVYNREARKNNLTPLVKKSEILPFWLVRFHLSWYSRVGAGLFMKHC